MSSVSFVAAQERVLARRAAQLPSQNPKNSPPQIHLSSSLFSRLIIPFSSAWATIRRREGTRPIFRVGQVDAELLDEELLLLLQNEAGQALKYYGDYLAEDWSAELRLALRAILFKLSIWDHNATYGAALQNLQYVDARSSNLIAQPPSKWQKSLHGIVTVFGRYAWAKWDSWLIERRAIFAHSDVMRLAERATSWLSTTHSIAALISFIVFLVNGRYRTLTDRLLGLRLASPSGQFSRQISFEYLNRQLVWHAFTEFLLFMLPLLGISRWRRYLGRLWQKFKVALQSRGGFSSTETPLDRLGPLAHLPESTCAICHQEENQGASSEAELLGVNAALRSSGVAGSASTDVVNPYQTIPCACVYCFVCLATKLQAEEGQGWTCLRCGEAVNSCQPWRGDVTVDEQPARPEDFSSINASADNDRDMDNALTDDMGSQSHLTELEPRQEYDYHHDLAASNMWSDAAPNVSPLSNPESPSEKG